MAAPVPSTAAPACLDCGAGLAAGQRYCPACGQRADVARLTLHDVLHEFTHALIHVDRSALALLRDLAIRPGLVAADFVRGARRRYFGPFGFLIVTVGVTSLAMLLTGFQPVVSPNPQNEVASFVSLHPNLLLLLQVPLLALVCRVVFFRAGYNFAEYLVLASYAAGMGGVFVLLVVLPVWRLLRPHSVLGPLLIGYWVIWCAYFGWAMAQFQGRRRVLAAAGGAFVAVASQVLATLILSAIASLLS